MRPPAANRCKGAEPPDSADSEDRPIGPSRRTLVAVGLYLAVSLLVLGGIATHVLQLRFAERDARLSQMLLELEARTAAHARERQTLESTIVGLRRDLHADHERLAVVAAEKARLAALGQRQAATLAALTDEAELARQRAGLLDRGARETALWLETAQRERMALERERAALQERLDALALERDLARRQEAGLRWRFGRLEERLAALSGDYVLATSQMQERIRNKLDAIERAVSRTGIDPAALLARAQGETGDGQGGPLIALDELQPSSGGALPIQGLDAALPTPLDTSFADKLTQALDLELGQLDLLPHLLDAIPLGAPLPDYRITSPFGVRTDPIAHRRARHGGLDLGAAPGSAATATAQGRVVAAGRRGGYGIMVEIDHGLGVTTRYAHLAKPLVEVGDRVAAGAAIGIIGSTGRSTGRHLHYEIRLDGEPLDPAGFIDVGHELLGILRG